MKKRRASDETVDLNEAIHHTPKHRSTLDESYVFKFILFVLILLLNYFVYF